MATTDLKAEGVAHAEALSQDVHASDDLDLQSTILKAGGAGDFWHTVSSKPCVTVPEQ